MKRTILAVAVWALAITAAAQPIAITGVSVIPMDSERVLGGHTVLTEGGHIAQLGPDDSFALPDDAQVFDGTGLFLIPGLSDMHAHVRRVEGQMPDDYMRQGITVIRNMQGEASHLEYRDGPARSGPVFLTAGQALAGRRIDRRHRIVTTPDEARAAVREQAAAGYDFIKVYSFLSLEVFDAILDEAAAVGLPVSGQSASRCRGMYRTRSERGMP